MKTGLKIWAWVIGITLLVSVLGLITKIIFFPVHVAEKTADTTKKVVDKTLDTDNVVFNYEQFHDLYNGAQQQVQNIKNVEKQIEELKDLYGEDATKWPEDVRKDYAHMKETIEGLQMQYNNLVSQYNSNSEKLNRKLFKDKNLPYELPLDYNQFPSNQ